MSHFRILGPIFFGLCLSVCTPAFADDGGIELKMVVEKEIKVKDENGKTIVKRVPPELVLPGDEIIYGIRYENKGDKDATDVVVNNPIQKDMLYKAGSAYGRETTITFSVDGGNHFDAPENLTVKLPDGTERPATESDYTTIRWTLNKAVAPKGYGHVGFRARVR